LESPGVVRRGDQRVGLEESAKPVPREGFAWREPLGPLEAAVNDVFTVAPAADVGAGVGFRPPGVALAAVFERVDPATHGGVVFLEDSVVAVMEIQGPGHVDAGVGPGSTAVGGTHEKGVVAGRDRHHARDSTVIELVGPNIAQPSGEDGGDVAVERSGATENGDVSGPSGFLPSGAVGRYLDEVRDL